MSGVSKGKKKGVTFTIDCSKAVEDKIMDIASLEKFVQERIKIPEVFDKDRNVYELRYFNIAENEAEEED
ncbi:unnamed protein product [Lupinus luteus]|uniref:Large ribosomal subunit protein eL22 n=1 Tax=Lupinus luteus TaxID=3873 RepID=A0AAV1WQG0_LUPLU